MLHPGPLVADGGLEIAVEPGAAPSLDLAAAADSRLHAFLRAAWFGAAAGAAPVATLTGRRAVSGEPIVALPLVERRLGWMRLREVPGSYWPYRSFPVASDASEAELTSFLASVEARAELGRAWRVGPVYADDATAHRTMKAARHAGWTVLTRRLGTCYAVDLKGLLATGSWPSGKTLRKNRWLERRLGAAGALEFSTVSGASWSAETFDRLAAIESESWVGRRAGPRDAKFLDPHNRRAWERAVGDPVIAGQLACSLLHVGGEPAAFTFSLRSGNTLYFIANSFSERFAEGSPGRILLYRDFQQAAAAGVETIGWGAGDPGYKSEMGARPGPEILDLLFVRGPLAALARPLWRSRFEPE